MAAPDRDGFPILFAGRPEPTRAHADDHRLARSCVAGDDDARRLVSEQFVRLAFSACIQSGLSRTDAQDVCQDAAIDMLASLPRYRGESRLSTWMFTLVGRRIADFFRAGARRHIAAGFPGGESFPALGAAADADAEQQTLAADARTRLWKEVARLAQPSRLILVAYYLGEMPVAEIAAVLEIPVGTVKTHLHRGRLALRARLDDPC
jgi:RNA polymerase sigma-70 factor (ECF subfamily)